MGVVFFCHPLSHNTIIIDPISLPFFAFALLYPTNCQGIMEIAHRDLKNTYNKLSSLFFFLWLFRTVSFTYFHKDPTSFHINFILIFIFMRDEEKNILLFCDIYLFIRSSKRQQFSAEGYKMENIFSTCDYSTIKRGSCFLCHILHNYCSLDNLFILTKERCTHGGKSSFPHPHPIPIARGISMNGFI